MNKPYWIRESHALDAQGNPAPGTATFTILRGQGPDAQQVDMGTHRSWALKRVAELNLHDDHELLKRDFDEVLDLMGRLAYNLDSTTEHMTHLPSKRNAEDLVRRAQELSHKHKKGE